MPTKLFYDFTTATSSRVRWTSLVLSFLASMKILTWLNGLWNEGSGAGRVVSREKKACGMIIYGVYLVDEIFLRQEEILQLNTLFSWKLCTGNWIHEAEEIKNKWKEEDDQEAISISSCCCCTLLITDLPSLKPVLLPSSSLPCHWYLSASWQPGAAQDTPKAAPLPSTCSCWAVPQNILCSIIP